MMDRGQVSVAAKFGAQVWDWIEGAPIREANLTRLYTRESSYCDEFANARRVEVEREVNRARRDEAFALAWAKRIVASGEMHDSLKRQPYSVMVQQADGQDFDDAVAYYRRMLAAGRFGELRVPPESRFQERRAFKEVQVEWLASLEGAAT